MLHLSQLRLGDGGHSEQHVYLLIEAMPGGPPRARLLPDIPQSRSWFAHNYHSLFFWLEDYNAGGSLAGFGFDQATAKAVVEGGSGIATQVSVWGEDNTGHCIANFSGGICCMFDMCSLWRTVVISRASVHQVWTFAPSEPILAVAVRDPKEVVQTSVKVSQRYKHAC